MVGDGESLGRVLPMTDCVNVGSFLLLLLVSNTISVPLMIYQRNAFYAIYTVVAGRVSNPSGIPSIRWHLEQ